MKLLFIIYFYLQLPLKDKNLPMGKKKMIENYQVI